MNDTRTRTDNSHGRVGDKDRPPLRDMGFGDQQTPNVRSRKVLPPTLRAGASAWVWIGVGVALVGFVLIALGWGQVAGETQVYRQLPYIVSASLIGLSLVMVGLAILNIVVRQRDALERDRQMGQLHTVLTEVAEALVKENSR